MPNRILREGILTSERVEKLNWAEEVFYRRLMSVVDDFGRFHARPALILAACYPLLFRKVSDSDVEKWLTVCVEAALVRVYPALDGKRYLEVLDFKQQVRAAKSKFPDERCVCIATATQVGSICEACAHLVVDVSVVGGGDGSVAKPPPKPKAPKAEKRTLPADFVVSENVRKWAEKSGFTRLQDHFEAFTRKAKAKAYAYADWDSAFMEAIREDWAKIRGNGNGGAPPPEPVRQRRELGA